MSTDWPRVPLGAILKRREAYERRDELAEYTFAGTYSYARGIFRGETKHGSEFRLPEVQRVRSGDFVYCKIMAWEGAFGIAPPETDNCVLSKAFLVYRVDESRAFADYLRLLFQLESTWRSIGGQSTGTNIRRRSLHPVQFERSTIPLPPLAEQRRITARVEEVAARIAEARHLREQASAEAVVVIRAALNELLATPLSGQLGDVLHSSPRNGWSAPCNNAESGTPVLALSAVTGFRYRGTEYKKTTEPTNPDADYWLRPGDVLITRSNTPELVGHAAIYDGQPSPCIYPDLMMRLDLDTDKADPRFLVYLLQGRQAREHIQRNAKGTSPSMKKISQNAVATIPFPSDLPLAEQRRIVAHLDALQAKADALRGLQAEMAAELDALLPAVLAKAFAGEL